MNNAQKLADEALQVYRATGLSPLEAIDAERRKHQESEMMAECMDMVRQDLIAAGLVDKSVPPMMLPEAILSTHRSAVAAERESCAVACEQSDRYRGAYFAEKIRARNQP